jgi:hypothetical protein
VIQVLADSEGAQPHIVKKHNISEQRRKQDCRGLKLSPAFAPPLRPGCCSMCLRLNNYITRRMLPFCLGACDPSFSQALAHDSSRPNICASHPTSLTRLLYVSLSPNLQLQAQAMST